MAGGTLRHKSLKMLTQEGRHRLTVVRVLFARYRVWVSPGLSCMHTPRLQHVCGWFGKLSKNSKNCHICL